MTEKLKKDFEDRWRTAEENAFHEIVERVSYNRQLGIHPNFVIAMALDPRFKSLEGGGFNNNETELIWNKVLSLMVEERNTGHNNNDQFYNNDNDNGDDNNINNTNTAGNGNNNTNNEEIVANNNNNNDDFFGFLHAMDENTLAQGGVRNILTEDEEEGQVQLECEDELKRYREEGNLTVFVNDNEYNNPLIWWKTKQLKFPTVAKLAKKYLGIPATSASSERIFSKARGIITGDRNRLAPEVVGTLFYINDNLEWYEGQQ
jgi:hypothetical protein